MSNSSSSQTNRITGMKVGIVDDSPLVRALIRDAVTKAPGMTVVGEAEDPYRAREMIKEQEPDVITLDIEMPRMNGMEFLEKIMRLRPMPVIMVSTLTQNGADITVKALEMGALDYVAKPLDQNNAEQLLAVFKRDLIQKLRQVNVANLANVGVQNRLRPAAEPQKQSVTKTNRNYDFIGIASSTGGVERLRFLISNLQVNIAPIAIVQHINNRYIPNLVSRVQQIAPPHITVKTVEDKEALKANTIYFADNVKHFTVKKGQDSYRAELIDDPPRNGFVASADYLFNAMAQIPDQRMLGLVLSGMGNDGAEGLRSLKESGARTVGENRDSCLVYGMSQAAANLGALTKETTIQGILAVLNNDKGER